jgi:sec-independent protein translocase protein TatB
MLDIGWQELFLIGVVALVVIGPKDLPQVMRTLAGLVRKARGLSREFQGAVDQMMREAELDELRRKLEDAGRADISRSVKDTVDPTGSLRADFDPAEFARELKQRVESGPTARPPHAGAPAAPGPADAGARDERPASDAVNQPDEGAKGA